MKTLLRPRHLFLLVALGVLPGCLATQTGSLEVLNPKQAYGKSVAVVSDLHRENEAIEKRLASDLQAAMTKRGLTVIDDPAKADLVVVPTLGRMRERSATPVDPVAPALESEPVEAATPVIAAPTPEARAFHRFSGGTSVTRGDLVARRAVPSARAPVGAQQAGLLLTAYQAKDYQDYGLGRQSLPPVWRIYVSQPAVQMKWNSVAVPLINAAANAAAPLGKAQNVEGRVKKDEPAAEQAEPRKERAKDQKTKRLKDEETAAEKKPET
jgi:hypothetical protein